MQDVYLATSWAIVCNDARWRPICAPGLHAQLGAWTSFVRGERSRDDGGQAGRDFMAARTDTHHDILSVIASRKAASARSESLRQETSIAGSQFPKDRRSPLDNATPVVIKRRWSNRMAECFGGEYADNSRVDLPCLSSSRADAITDLRVRAPCRFRPLPVGLAACARSNMTITAEMLLSALTCLRVLEAARTPRVVARRVHSCSDGSEIRHCRRPCTTFRRGRMPASSDPCMSLMRRSCSIGRRVSR
jgi:hypothetical protein